MTKTHQLDIPAEATKDWVITRIDPESKEILLNDIEELLAEADALAEDSLYSDDCTTVSQAIMRLSETIRSLVQVFL